MKAVRIAKTGGRDVLQVVTDLPIPRPSARQAVVKNSYAGINFIDTYFREGLYKHELPMTLGKEGAGVVVEAGPGSDVKKGDRVVYSATCGSYAQYAVVDTNAVAIIPEGISDESAAASFVQGLTAMTLVEETYAVKKGEWALVHAAAGGMGSWLVQILANLGVNVIATASTQEKLQFAKDNGAHHLINYKHEDVVAKVREIVPQGVHVVYDGVGASTFDMSLECLRRKGFLASFGNASGAVPPFSLLRLAPKCLKVARPQVFGYLVEPEEVKYYTGKLFDQLRAGINVHIHKTYSIEDIEGAHEELEGGLTTGKLLIKF